MEQSAHSLLSEPAEAFPWRIVRASGSGMLSLLNATEENGLMKGRHVAMDGDVTTSIHQE
ncbi:hypothetical protein KDW_39890 [Dictyobacter vulcani]|uniref:Uncharacterized protein n=1 Tax=Dictyobacter vulcani TaxID=2607529 RepID=A0A5J4KTR8_9CHLR|nr:hypothetical protein KDW_39890 [Dictyobacter vulcani]